MKAKKGSVGFILGQTWHQIGRNLSEDSRWCIIIHYKRWWIKPSTDFTKGTTNNYLINKKKEKGKFVKSNFVYNSNTNPHFLEFRLHLKLTQPRKLYYLKKVIIHLKRTSLFLKDGNFKLKKGQIYS